MAALSDYAENKVLDHLLGVSEFTMPSTVYLALFTSDPTDTGQAGTEVSGGGYVRQAVTASAASGGQSQNSQEVLFPEATEDWGVITHVGIYDSQTGGNMLLHSEVTNPREFLAGDSFRVDVGGLTVNID